MNGETNGSALPFGEEPVEEGAGPALDLGNGGDTVNPEIALLFSGNPAKVFEALAKAQAEFTKIKRDRTGQIGHRAYKYATLDEINEATRPALSKYGLAVMQPWSGGRLFTILGHSSGAAMVAVVDLATTKTTGEGKNALQDMGSTLTYYRRYALQSVLGLAAEEDDDGARGGGSSGSGGGRSEAAITTPAPARKPDAEIRMPVARGEILGTAKPLVAVPPPAPAPVAGPVQEADEPGIVIFSDLKLTKKVAKEAPDGVSPHWVRTAFLTDTGRWVYTFETGATHADGSETVVAAMEKALTAGAPVRLRTRERKMTNGSVGYEVLAVS